MPGLGQLASDPSIAQDPSDAGTPPSVQAGTPLPPEQQDDIHSGMLKPEDLTQEDQHKYLGKIKKRNKYLLLELTEEEKKRVGNYIIDLYNDALPEHELICQKIDDWDEVSRLVRKEVIGSEGELPNYRMPISFLTHEVIHSNVMNTFFSPQEPMRVIPTAIDDIEKVDNICVFGNWSMKNEMDLFTAFDKLDHASIKNGESVAMIYWKKEYGVEIERIPMKNAEGNVIYDEETKDPVFWEREKDTLLYNAPYMEIISRKDYIQAPDCLMDEIPQYEGVIRMFTYDSFLRDEEMGMYYKWSLEKIQDWPNASQTAIEKQTIDGEDQRVPGWSKEFLCMFLRMRVEIVKKGIQDNEAVEMYDLEDELEAVVNIKTKTLCSLKKNRRPMKERPFVNDYFQPDDSGRRVPAPEPQHRAACREDPRCGGRSDPHSERGGPGGRAGHGGDQGQSHRIARPPGGHRQGKCDAGSSGCLEDKHEPGKAILFVFRRRALFRR